jgi:hypothetical protein
MLLDRGVNPYESDLPFLQACVTTWLPPEPNAMFYLSQIIEFRISFGILRPMQAKATNCEDG